MAKKELPQDLTDRIAREENEADRNIIPNAINRIRNSATVRAIGQDLSNAKNLYKKGLGMDYDNSFPDVDYKAAIKKDLGMKKGGSVHTHNVEHVKKHAAGHQHEQDKVKGHAAGHKPHHEHVKAMCGGGYTKGKK